MYNAVTHLFFRSESGRGLRAARRLEAALSPSRTNADESLSTLNYAKCRGGGPQKKSGRLSSSLFWRRVTASSHRRAKTIKVNATKPGARQGERL